LWELHQILELAQNLGVTFFKRNDMVRQFGWTKDHFKQTQRRLARLRDELFPPAEEAGSWEKQLEELRDSYRHLLKKPKKTYANPKRITERTFEEQNQALLEKAARRAAKWQQKLRDK